MREPRQCERIDLSTLERSCPVCCEALRHRRALEHTSPASSKVVCAASDFAEGMGISLAELHEFAGKQEIPR
jgi:hypothetical protein